MKCISDWAEKNKISTPTNSRANQIITTYLSFSLWKMGILPFCSPPVSSRFYDIVQKTLEVFSWLRYWVTVNVFWSYILHEFLHKSSLSTSISINSFSLENKKRKMKLTFRWNITCADWPPFCPLLTSSRCPSSSKFKRISRPRRSFRITQMTLEV